MAEQEAGFELDGVFYRWTVSDVGKDLMLIDKFTQMPVHEFFEIVNDSFDRNRPPILLAMIATSIRAHFPDRSVERIYRDVLNLSLGEVEFIDGEDDEETVEPEAGQSPPADSTLTTTRSESSSEPSSQPASPASTQTTSERSNAIPA